MSPEQEILTVKQAAKLTPWSERTLYNIAKRDPNSPFRLAWNQIVTTKADLLAWVRDSPRPVSNPDPMPPVRKTVDDLLQQMAEINQSNRSI